MRSTVCLTLVLAWWSLMLTNAKKHGHYYHHHSTGHGSGPVDGGFSGWSWWTHCSAPCRGGRQYRTRSCTNPEPRNGGKGCVGEVKEIRPCNCQPCGGPPECRMAMDFGIIVDTSGSVGKANIIKIRHMLKTLIDDFDISQKETRVGLITYSTWATLQFPFNKYFTASQMKKHIDHMWVRIGGTRTDRAFELASKAMFNWLLGFRYNTPNVLMVITDGKTNPGSKPYSQVLRPLKRLGVTTIAVGVGSGTNDEELLEIAMDEQDNVIHMDSYDDLKERLQSMMKQICHGVRKKFMATHSGK